MVHNPSGASSFSSSSLCLTIPILILGIITPRVLCHYFTGMFIPFSSGSTIILQCLLQATNFNNVNVIGKDRPLAELDTKPIQKALTVLNAFQVHLNLHMSQMIPITIFASSVSKFTLSSPTNNSICAVTPVSDGSSPEADKNQPGNQKRTPAFPDDLVKAVATQHKKKVRHNGITDSSARIRPVTDKGMFFLQARL
jgi:hypothetical protein